MSYSCSVCGQEGKKLWSDARKAFCICASCAEKRQIPLRYPVYSWINKGNCFYATPIGTETRKWEVNSKGKIPTNFGFDPYGEPVSVTDILPIMWDGSEIEVYPFLTASCNLRSWVDLPTR